MTERNMSATDCIDTCVFAQDALNRSTLNPQVVVMCPHPLCFMKFRDGRVISEPHETATCFPVEEKPLVLEQNNG